MTSGDPFIVMCAPSGARHSKADHPGIPFSAVELAETAQAILDSGASILHLHVRDESGRHTLEPARYRTAIAAIRNQVGDKLVIQVTTEACGAYSAEQQISVVRDLKPEAVSIAIRELVPDRDEICDAGRFFEWLKSNSVMPQYILYSPEEARWFDEMRQNGLFADELPFVLFVLGRYGTAEFGDPGDIEAFRQALSDERIPWAACCFGPREDETSAHAAMTGGHARVGFENNLLMADGSTAPDNATLVSLAAGHAQSAGRQLATADQVRQLFL